MVPTAFPAVCLCCLRAQSLMQEAQTYNGSQNATFEFAEKYKLTNDRWSKFTFGGSNVVGFKEGVTVRLCVDSDGPLRVPHAREDWHFYQHNGPSVKKMRLCFFGTEDSASVWHLRRLSDVDSLPRIGRTLYCYFCADRGFPSGFYKCQRKE